jgi:C1A family cysteine protease
MFKIGGYRHSGGNNGCEAFSAKIDKFAKLASVQNDTHILPEFTPLSNQGPIGSCVANATADGLEMLKGLEDASRVEQVSRLFIYYNARVYQNEVNVDDGCYIHDALASLTKLGACRETTWDYNVGKVFTHPTLEAYREANDNTITEFYQITASGTERINQIELALRAMHPIIFGTRVGSEFQSYYGEDKVFSIPSDDVGGHAMLVTGVRTNATGSKEFYVRNSWGTGWGKQGHVWISADYLMWKSTNDLFVPTRMIDFLI